jgi:hypothetical protein
VNHVFLVLTDFVQVAQTSIPGITCLIDSSATQHFEPKRTKFLTYQDITLMPITSADGNMFYAVGQGGVPVHTAWEGQPVKFTLQKVLHAPKMLLAFLSVHSMANSGYGVHFEKC